MRRMTEIGDFIAERDPAAAFRTVESLFNRVGGLADHPHLGVVFPGSPTDNVRVMYFGQYRVFYLLDSPISRVTILTVRHGRQAPLSLEETLSKDEP
mgnify:CR=1 FL=1